ncbi:MAG: NACHT domain-containing protein, partial [Acidobacteriota bacterium]
MCFVSALEYVWTYKLGIPQHDPEGHRERVKTSLTNLRRWVSDEDQVYVVPQLNVDRGSLAPEARLDLESKPPVFPGGATTVLYGAGGIGKTEFLRRAHNLLARWHKQDPLCPVPVFVALPPLLHQDIVETTIVRDRYLRGLTISEASALIENGILTLLLDAFDEVVKGQEREASRRFLRHLSDLALRGAQIVISSRDYYLSIDPLLKRELSSCSQAWVTLRFFDTRGRRRFLSRKTGLGEKVVNKWSERLEMQVAETLRDFSQEEKDALVGHPLFLDAFARYVNSFSRKVVARAADAFQFRSPDVFKEVLDHILQREYSKSAKDWKARFGEVLMNEWRSGPFTIELQRKVLTELALEVVRQDPDSVEQHYGKDWLRGLFAPSEKELPEPSPRRQKFMASQLRKILGTPAVVQTIADERRDEVCAEVFSELATFYLKHPLSDTSSEQPDDLIFAFSNRAYFEYILSEALTAKLLETIHQGFRGDAAAELVSFIEGHHILEKAPSAQTGNARGVGRFMGALDFILWNRKAIAEGPAKLLEAIRRAGSAPGDLDDVYVSYLLSIATALVMRRQALGSETPIQNITFAPVKDWKLQILSEFAPVVWGLKVQDCSFPLVRLEEIVVRDLECSDCDFEGLSFVDSELASVKFDRVEAGAVEFGGRVKLRNSVLDISNREDGLKLEPGAKVELWECSLSAELNSSISALGYEEKTRIVL